MFIKWIQSGMLFRHGFTYVHQQLTFKHHKKTWQISKNTQNPLLSALPSGATNQTTINSEEQNKKHKSKK